MDVSRIFLKTANSLLSAVIVLFLVVAGAYSAYALWDNMQVYASVDDIQSQLLKYKPTPGEDNSQHLRNFGQLIQMYVPGLH